MFESDWFRKGVEDAVQNVLRLYGVESVKVSIPDKLISLAKNNEPFLFPREMTREAFQEKTPEDAFKSAMILTRDAVFFAKEAGRSIVTEADFELAYGKNFCRIWPFCR